MALQTLGSRGRYIAAKHSRTIQNDAPPLASTAWTSIFCPLSHNLPAVDGATWAEPLPLYTAVFACNANKNTNAHSMTSCVRHSAFVFVVLRFTADTNLHCPVGITIP